MLSECCCLNRILLSYSKGGGNRQVGNRESTVLLSQSTTERILLDVLWILTCSLVLQCIYPQAIGSLLLHMWCLSSRARQKSVHGSRSGTPSENDVRAMAPSCCSHITQPYLPFSFISSVPFVSLWRWSGFYSRGLPQKCSLSRWSWLKKKKWYCSYTKMFIYCELAPRRQKSF